MALSSVCVGGNGLYAIVCVCVVSHGEVPLGNGLSRVLLRLEEMDRALLRRGIDVRCLFGLLNDGSAQWRLIRRRNAQRLMAKDVLNDSLFDSQSNGDLAA